MGGGVMRAAAKVAGIGVLNHGLRGGIQVAQPAEQSLIRGAKRPVSAIAASQGEVSADVAPVHKVSSDIVDDWDCVEEEVVVVGEPIGRLVFGGVPTLEEAKEATNDLKDALESFLSSPRSTGSGGSHQYPPYQMSAPQSPSSSGHADTKSCVTLDPKASAPKYAFQAFQLLSENPAAKSVVASIACDPNVWNAVLKNDALTEFLQSQKTDAELHEYQHQESPRSVESTVKFEDFPDASEESSGRSVSDFLQKVKTTVAEMVNNVSDYLHKIFGSPAAEKASADAKEDGGSMFNIDMSGYFVSLAVMVIAVVVLKRW
ncbi:hypothetical protein SLE2022_017460 [Rubroshorea leprosula]